MLLSLKFLSTLLLTWGLVASANDECCKKNRTGHAVSYFDRLFAKMIPPDYNYQKPPRDDGVQLINVSYLFFSISQVVFDTMEIEVEFLMYASWIDKRLDTEKMFNQGDINDMMIITVPTASVQSLWVPRIIFSNCKHCSNGEAIGRNREVLFHPGNKEFLTYYRETMSFACAFQLAYFPFDSHECSVSLQLMEFTRMKLKLNAVEFPMHPDPEDFVKSGMPPAFDFVSVSLKQACSQRSPVLTNSPDHCLQYNIQMHRRASYHLMLVYCPTTAIVVISWISFWLSVEASAPRITLGLTSLLTLTTQFASEQKSLPPVSYIKALDVWMLMCVFMVFGSLLEFTLAHTYRFSKKTSQNIIRVNEEPKTLQPHALSNVNKPISAKVSMDCKKTQQRTDESKQKEVSWLDHKARVAFPLIFLLFNLFYWPCYATE